jgi:CSLREA domain-containing protein
LATAGVAQAAVFTVNSPSDLVDINPGDGVCHTGAGTPTCTLRAAIQEANALGGANEIILPPNNYVLMLASELVIIGNLTITGGGAATTIIDGNRSIRPNSGVLNIGGAAVVTGATVNITGVTIRNGQRDAGFGGGIHNELFSVLTLTNSTVSVNSSRNGGGIFNVGTLTLVNSTVSGNDAVGGSDASGGGIWNFKTLTLVNSTVSGNNASRNTAIGDNGGGGIYNFGTLTLTNSTVSKNTTNGIGGGIFSEMGALTLTNSTVSGNSAFASGGGIYNSGSTSVFNGTITDNRSDFALANAGNGGGVYNNTGATFSFQNTILAGNWESVNVVGTLVHLVGECTGSLTSNGNNLMTSYNATRCTVNGSAPILATTNFGPLQNNGGPTQTHALLAGSAAINAGNPTGCRDQFGALMTTDQRGFPRPSNGTACDIGSYEFFAIACPGQSLQAAINAANPGDIIPVTGTCNENIIIRNEKQRLTVDGLGTAIIHGLNAGSPTLNVRGKGILIQNFAGISGGSHGIHVNRGSNAVIDNNTIQSTGAHGILVDELAFAVVVNNSIENNPGAGVFVGENSTARVGFNSDSETLSAGNSILNNGVGVVVSNNSSARIVGNTIGANSGPGIQVSRESHADIASNTLNGNGGSGIEIEENSVGQLGEDSGTGIFESSNSGTSTGFGIKCVRGGLADGRQGSLSGDSGATSFDGSCTNSLVP